MEVASSTPNNNLWESTKSSRVEDIDDLSLALALSLQLQDFEDFKSASKGKGKEGVLSDVDAALLLHKQCLSQVSQDMADRRLALSISTAVAQDQNILVSLAYAKQQEDSDHAFAVGLDNQLRGNRTENAPPNLEQAATNDQPVLKEPDEFSEILSTLSTSTFDKFYFKDGYDDEDHSDDISTIVAESSKTAASRFTMTSKKCVACLDLVPVSQVIRCPCQHNYCIPCMRYLFQTATTDESLYPPRCCGNIFPASIALRLLEHNELKAFCAKGVEHTAINRVYCARKPCSTFIPPWHIKDELATCPECSTVTHILCHALQHPGKDCPEDEALQQVIQLGADKSWQRCYGCHAMVELERGCNHMTCKCGKEFCYECAAPWHTCDCPLWDERNLMDVVHRVAERDAVEGEDIDVAEQRIREVRQALQVHEDVGCKHHRRAQWRWRDNIDLECEVCFKEMPQYIFECRNCRMAACNRCIRNRLR